MFHEVDRLAGIAVRLTKNVKSPGYEEAHYYAVFFETPAAISGNLLRGKDIGHR